MRSIAVVTLIALAAVGCGKGKSESVKSGTPPVTLSGAVNDKGTKDLGGKTDVEVEQDDFYFNPTFVKAQPGATIKVELKNEGSVSHTFTIDALHVDVTLDKGASKDVTVTLPQSGAVPFYCKFHRGQGMQGAFYFNAGDQVSGGSAPSSGGDPYGYQK